MNSPLVVLENVTKTYMLGEIPVEALRGVDLELARGEVVVLLGPSGSGKTTLINIIGGLDTPTTGTVTVADQDITTANEDQLTRFRRDTVSFVFQFFNLVPTLTARENVELVAEISNSQSDCLDLLRRVGLGERADHFPHQLSGGEQQRVAIARALAKDPLLLLADEPTGNLDFRTGITVLEVLREINRTDGLSMLLVTHNEVIAEMADTVVRLRSGQVVDVQENESPLPASKIRW
jgi:putative ABC transport system ATP-binding protein